MPDWFYALTDPEVNRTRAVSIGLVGASGERLSVAVTGLGAADYSLSEVTNFRKAVGDITNAAIIRMTESKDDFIAIKNATAYDELFDTGKVLMVTLQNNNGETQTIEVPAPDQKYFDDGVTFILGSETGATHEQNAFNFRQMCEELINNSYFPANSFSIIRATLRSRRVKLSTGTPPLPVVSEPIPGSPPF